ncbi:hypothetical protein U1Q18_025143, partial [Sarracenia purpurea var. burkii]
FTLWPLPIFDEYEVSFPSLPSRKELSSPKEQKQQSIEPSSHRSIIEEAMSLHDNLEALIRDNPTDVKLSEVFRAEKISLEAEVEAYSICPDSLLLEKIEAIEARIQKIKELTSEVEIGIVKTIGSESTGLGTEIKLGDVAVWKRSGIGEGPLAKSVGDDPSVNAEANEQGNSNTHAGQMLVKMPKLEEEAALDGNTSNFGEDVDEEEVGTGEEKDTEEDEGEGEDGMEVEGVNPVLEFSEKHPLVSSDTVIVGSSQATFFESSMTCIQSDFINVVEGVDPECLYGNVEKRHGESKALPCSAHNLLEEMSLKVSVPRKGAFMTPTHPLEGESIPKCTITDVSAEGAISTPAFCAGALLGHTGEKESKHKTENRVAD